MSQVDKVAMVVNRGRTVYIPHPTETETFTALNGETGETMTRVAPKLIEHGPDSIVHLHPDEAETLRGSGFVRLPGEDATLIPNHLTSGPAPVVGFGSTPPVGLVGQQRTGS